MMDPAGRRARNVVLLVIFTVALPSVLLTVLGAVAVRNEEAAAKRRVEKLYGPVRGDVADVFNDRFDDLTADSGRVLGQLAAWSTDPDRALDDLECFVDDHPEAINFFVMDDEGQLLVPAVPAAPLVGANCAAAERCFAFPPAEYGDLEAKHADACAESARLASITGLFDAECSAGVEPHVIARSRNLVGTGGAIGADDASAFLEEAESFARLLTDPRRAYSSEWLEVVATAVLRRLRTLPAAQTRNVMALYVALANRAALFEAQPTVAHHNQETPIVVGSGTKEWRRIVISARYGDVTAGFEVLPTPFEAYLEGALADKKLDEALHAYIGPVGVPEWWFPLLYPEVVPYVKKKDDTLEVSWALLTKSELNWVITLALRDPGLIPNLAHSRSRLYLWALVLIGNALLVGIIYTVRSVIAEARLSRLKTDFVSSVSHDLRTPLTSIRMFSEMLHEKQVSSEEEEEEFLGIIVEEAERLSRLVERILDFSRMEAGRKAYSPSPAEVAPMIEHALRATKPMILAAEFEVLTDVPEGLPRVHVDRDAILEVLVNLISNAVKYSPHQKKICISADEAPDGVNIRVKDHGIGISEAEQRRIFEKFYRVNTKRAAEVSGSGIGLSLVDHIVSAHGGSVTVDSAPGEGSTFTVTLPFQPAPPVEQAETEDAPLAARAGDMGWRASSS